MSLTQYIDRKYDVMAFQNVSPAGDTLLRMELFDTQHNGTIVTGMQKLAQRWLLEFLTEVGSMPGLPLRGSSFMADVRKGTLGTFSDIASSFIFAAAAVRANLQLEETPAWPDDERIAVAALLTAAFLPGFARIGVKISSRAGENRQVILPISTLPENFN